MAELDEQPVARLDHAQHFLKPSFADETAEALAGFSVIRDRDFRLEEARKHLPPAVEGFTGLISDRRIAGEIESHNVVRCGGDLDFAYGRMLADELEGQPVIPVEIILLARLK